VAEGPCGSLEHLEVGCCVDQAWVAVHQAAPADEVEIRQAHRPVGKEELRRGSHQEEGTACL
jgi:hypothetical protein